METVDEGFSSLDDLAESRKFRTLKKLTEYLLLESGNLEIEIS